jgi:hypothetical protein
MLAEPDGQHRGAGTNFGSFRVTTTPGGSLMAARTIAASPVTGGPCTEPRVGPLLAKRPQSPPGGLGAPDAATEPVRFADATRTSEPYFWGGGFVLLA